MAGPIISTKYISKQHVRFFFLFLFFSFLSTAAFSQHIWVATDGSDTNAGDEQHPYATIAKAISTAGSGAIINIEPGTYAERIVIDKKLTLIGSNAGKSGNDPLRGAEAKIVPPTTDFSSAAPLPVVKFIAGSAGSVFDGFEVNGDNSSLTGSGVISGGAEVDAAFGILVEDEGNITIKNNLVQNFGSDEAMPYAVGISVINNTGGKVTSGIIITGNYIKNLNQSSVLAVLDGITIENNAYAQVTGNKIENVREGIQFNNHYAPNPDAVGFPAEINNNDIASYRSGIYNNQQKSNASPWTVSNNTLQSMTGPSGNTIYEGIRVETITGTVDITIDGNTIIGHVTDRLKEDPDFIVTGISFKNNVNTTGTLLVKGNDISKVLDGIVYETDNSAAKLTTNVKYEGGNIHDVKRDYVRYEIAAGMTTPVADVNLPSTQLDGKTGADYTAVEVADIESGKITDKDDNPLYGKVNFVFPVENVSKGTYYATIQDAVDDADPNNEIHVPAGTYAERVVVNKPLTIEGPNAGKAGDDPVRVAEAIIIPPSTKISGEGSDGLQVPMVKFGPGSAGSTFDGFEVNGDNPTLMSSGVDVSGTGISVDAAFGIRVEGVGDVAIQNNVVENLGSKPISKFGYPYALGISAMSTTPVSGIQISRNYIKNMSQTDAVADLDAVMIIDNAYAQVTHNKMDAVRIGVQFENQGTANPQATSFPATVSYNDISAYRAGIYYNLQHPNASPWTISNNKLRSIKNPTGNAIYEGIRVESIEGAVDGTISNNIIIGNVADRMEEDGSSIVTGISFKNKVNTTGTFLVKDNDISGVLDGIVYKTDNSAAKLTTNVKYEGGNIHDVQRDYVRYEVALGTTDIADVNLPSTQLDGKTGAEYTTAEVADIESQKIIDKKDNPLYGRVNFVFTVEDVTQGTYYATIQDAVDAADPNDEIKVPAGTYAERVVVDKPLTIEGPNAGKTGDDATRVAEAKIIPPGTDFNSASPLPVVKFEAGAKGSVFDGFEVNGDNPTLPTSGVIVNGLSVDAAFGIRIENEGDITIENNLVQNFGSNETMPYAIGVSVINTTGGKVTSGILIKDNYIKHLNQSPALAVLDAITMENNAYGQITGNKIEDVREGIQINNHFTADPNAGSFHAAIAGNDITSYRSGIYDNQQKASASPWTVNGNTLQSMAGPADNNLYEGIRVETITGSVSDTISGNTIMGNVAARTSENPSFTVTGISFKNNVSTTGTLTVKNNDISQVVNGIVYTAAAGTHLTADVNYTGGNIHDVTGDYIHYQTVGGTYADINLPSTELDGKKGKELSPDMLETIESTRITDQLDNPAFGRVNFIFPVENLTRGTFFGTIQGAINAAGTQDGDVINVDAGTYTLTTGINVTKSVTLQGNNLNLTDKPLITGVGGTAHKALFYVTAPDVTIRNFHLQFAEENANAPASVTSYGILTGDNGTFGNLTIADNLIEGTNPTYVFNSYGIFTGSQAGSVSDKVTIQGNTIGHTVANNALGRAIRTWHTYGSMDDNNLKGFYASIDNSVPGGSGAMTITGNTLEGKVIMNTVAAGTQTISNNTITSGGKADAQGKTAADRQPALIEIVSSDMPSASVEISGNTLNDFKLYGVAVFASDNVSIENNIFNPLANTKNFAAVYFDTKTTNSGTLPIKTYQNLKVKGNTFNGSGVAGGTGLEFANSNGAATIDPLTGIIIGGAEADANTFSGELDTYISLSDTTGLSDGIDPWKPTSPYYSGTATTQAFPFSSGMNAFGNNFGGVDPEIAGNAALYNLETKINDGIDNGVTGLVTIKEKMAFPASAKETQNAFAVVPDENYTVLVKAGTDLSTTTLMATKDITLDAEDDIISMEQITMNGTGKTLTLNKPVELTDSLVLKAGVLATTHTNILKLTENAEFSGPVKGAYIDGPVAKTKKAVVPSVIFPVGKNGLTAPIAISDVPFPVTYTVEYFKMGYSKLNHDGTLDGGVSHREYWTVSQEPVEEFHVTLYSFDPEFSGFSLTNEILVARYNNNDEEWKSLDGNYITGGPEDPVGVKSIIASPSDPEAIFTFGGRTSSQDFSNTNISNMELPPDSLYKAGDALNFIVHFSTDVAVNPTGGKPVLSVDLGSGTVSAVYVSSADDSIIFRYTVKDPDLDDDGITANDLSLDLGGATIKAGSDNADLTIQGVRGGTGIQVDGVAPVISSVMIPNTEMKIGNVVTATIKTTADPDTYLLDGGTIGDFTLSNFAKVDNTTYTATFTIADGGTDLPAGDDIPVNIALMDKAGNSISYTTPIAQNADPIYATVPAITAIDKPDKGNYGVGDNLDFTVHYSRNVTVTGLPIISITIGNTQETAAYIKGNSTNSLVFRYTVQNGDLDQDGITVADFISGIIKDAGGNKAGNDFTKMGATAEIRVDGVIPKITSVSVPPNGIYTKGEDLSFTVNFSEPVMVTGTDATLDLTIGSISKEATYVSNKDNNITFTYKVQAGDLDIDGININSLSLNTTGISDSAHNDADIKLINIDPTDEVRVDAVKPVINSGASFTIDENSAGGTQVGTLTATDALSSHPLEWMIISGNPDSTFVIDANGAITVTNNATLDYEKISSYTLKVTVNDGVYTSDPVDVIITVNNVNDKPVGISLSKAEIYENNTIGAVIGTFQTSDEDKGATFSYTLVSGQGDADNASFTIDGAQLKAAEIFDFEQKVSYSILVRSTDDGDFSIEKVFTITIKDINEAPVINVINDTSVCAGMEPHTIQVTGISGGPEAGQPYNLSISADKDYFDDLAIDPVNANKAAIHYTLKPKAEGDIHIKVTVKDDGGIANGGKDTFSRSFTLTVNQPVAITTQPEDKAFCVGGNTTFTVNATGTDLKYQWQSSTDGTTWNNVSGGTSETLELSNLQTSDNGTQYRVLVNGTCDNVTSSAATLTLNHPAAISQQPAAITVCMGSNATFNVSATGTGLSYQWQSSTDGTTWNNVSGGTSETLELSNLQTSDNGKQYRVVVSGTCDNIISDAVTLTVNPLPDITITADNKNPVSKGIVTRLTASGADTYEWTNGPGIQNGWNDATLTLRPQQDATYTVTGTSAAGCMSSQSYDVKIVVDYKLICNNILSPNGDGKNDTWIIQNISSYLNNKLMIFDRTGRMIYEKENYDNQWNGTINGRRLHEGTYYYVFIVDGGKKVFKGYIELLSGNQ